MGEHASPGRNDAAMRSAIGAVAQSVAQLLFPLVCGGCGAPGYDLCDECAAQLSPQHHARTLAGALVVQSGLPFDDTVAAVLHAIKRDHRVGLARYLAPALHTAVTVAAGPESRLALVPIPPTPRAQRERGFSVVHELCLAARLPAINALRLVRAPADQRGLNRMERAHNMSGAFTLDPASLRGAQGVVLVDDVVTTGATLVSAAATCTANGVRVLSAATAVTTLATHVRGNTRPSERGITR